VTVNLGNEVQLVTVSATGGTFTLTFGGQTTSTIAWNAAASAVQTALRALSTIGATGVTVSGSGGGPFTVSFTGTLQDTDVAQMTSSAAGLTGGAQTCVVTTVTQGHPIASEIIYVDTSVVGSTKSAAEVLIGQAPPVGYVRVSKKDYYGNA
jgi:hypothetical protein